MACASAGIAPGSRQARKICFKQFGATPSVEEKACSCSGSDACSCKGGEGCGCLDCAYDTMSATLGLAPPKGMLQGASSAAWMQAAGDRARKASLLARLPNAVVDDFANAASFFGEAKPQGGFRRGPASSNGDGASRNFSADGEQSRIVSGCQCYDAEDFPVLANYCKSWRGSFSASCVDEGDHCVCDVQCTGTHGQSGGYEGHWDFNYLLSKEKCEEEEDEEEQEPSEGGSVAIPAAPDPDEKCSVEVAARHFGRVHPMGYIYDHAYLIATLRTGYQFAIHGAPDGPGCPGSPDGCLYVRVHATDGITTGVLSRLPPVNVARGTAACAAIDCIEETAVAINDAHMAYFGPMGPNSNSAAYTMLVTCGLPASYPVGALPQGWGMDILGKP